MSSFRQKVFTDDIPTSTAAPTIDTTSVANASSGVPYTAAIAYTATGTAIIIQESGDGPPDDIGMYDYAKQLQGEAP